MTELSFAKLFLVTLSNLQTKISLDHVEDPKKYPLRATYNLPKHTQPQLKKRRLNSDTTSTITIFLKSQRNPPLNHTLSSQQPTTSILEIKNTLSTVIHVPSEKIKLLHNKKPVADTKVLKDLLVTNTEGSETCNRAEETIELGVMIIGDTSVSRVDIASTAQLPVESTMVDSKEMSLTKENLLDKDEFWLGLRHYFEKTLQDTCKSEYLVEEFKSFLKEGIVNPHSKKLGVEK